MPLALYSQTEINNEREVRRFQYVRVSKAFYNLEKQLVITAAHSLNLFILNKANLQFKKWEIFAPLQWVFLERFLLLIDIKGVGRQNID